jgi:acyl carrier protein
MRETVLEIIRSTNSRVEPSSLDPDRSLLDQGLDSLDMLSVYTKIEDEAGTRIPVENVGEMVTVDQLAAFMKSARSTA